VWFCSFGRKIWAITYVRRGHRHLRGCFLPVHLPFFHLKPESSHVNCSANALSLVVIKPVPELLNVKEFVEQNIRKYHSTIPRVYFFQGKMIRKYISSIQSRTYECTHRCEIDQNWRWNISRLMEGQYCRPSEP